MSDHSSSSSSTESNLSYWLGKEVAKTITERAYVSEGTLLNALESRYGGADNAFFRHVRDSTGHGAARTADAVVVGLWPSRGMEIEGFECKISRSDWLRELKDPSKAENIFQFCDHWWLVVAEDKIVVDGELPKTWGLMVLRKGKIVIKVQAPTLTPKALDRGFVASILRKAPEMIAKSDIKAELDAKYQEGRKAGEECRTDQWAKRELEALKKGFEEFKEASGIELSSWNGRQIGNLVKFFTHHGTSSTIRSLRDYRKSLEDSLKIMDAQLVKIQEEANKFPDRS